MASSVASGSGSSVRVSARTSSFTQLAPGLSSPCSNSRPSRAVRSASSAEKHPAVFGKDRVPVRIEIVEEVAALLIKQSLATHGHGDDFRAAGLEAISHQLER